MHRLTTIDTASVDIRLRAVLRILDKLDEVFVDRNNFALRTQLNFSRPVIRIGNSSTMTFELALGNEDELSN